MSPLPLRPLTVLALFALSHVAVSQSTSPWIPVSPSAPAGASLDSVVPTVGDSYLTVEFVAASVYQYSTWWTNFVERNREGVLTATLSGEMNGRVFDDVRSSGPIQLRRNRSQVDIGWSQVLVRRLPTTYSRLTLTVAVSKTSKDGLTDLLNTLSTLSTTTPGLQVSQTSLGVVTATKAVADFLFNRQLLVQRLKSTIQFPDSGTALPAGLYASFAADTSAQYAAYLRPTALTWNGAQLLSESGAPISDLSYFVVRVGYTKRIFADPLASLSLSLAKPWAALYQIAAGKTATLVTRNDGDKLATEIRNHLVNGNTLLDNDPDFIQAERDVIKNAVRDLTQARLNERLAHLPAPTPAPSAIAASGLVVTPPSGTPTEPGTPGNVLTPPIAPPGPVILVIPDDPTGKALLTDAQEAELKSLREGLAKATGAAPPR